MSARRTDLASTPLSMIVLAYNDAPSLPRLVPAVHAKLSGLTETFEIVIVDDGSSDDTAAVAGRLETRFPEVRLVRHPVNQGVGAGFQTGVQEARFAHVGYMDGDGQYRPEDLPALMEALPGHDAAVGVRVRRADPCVRSVVSAFYRLCVRAIYGVPFRDINCGLKIFRQSFLQKVAPLHSMGSFFDAELLIKGMAAGLRIKEVSVEHLPRLHGKARGISLRSIRSALAGIVDIQMRPYVRRNWFARSLRWLIDQALILNGRSFKKQPI